MTKRANLFDVFHGKLAIKHQGLQMFFVREMHKVRHVMYFFPERRCFVFPVFCEFLNARLVGGDHLVTTHTFTGGRDARHLATACIGMAVHAVNAIILNVNDVRKFNRLLHILAVVCTNGWRHIVFGSHCHGGRSQTLY